MKLMAGRRVQDKKAVTHLTFVVEQHLQKLKTFAFSDTSHEAW